MFKWRKLGLLFNPENYRNQDWLYEFAQAPSAIIFDHHVRVYFSCRPKADSQGQYVSYSAYVDLDRSDLSRIIAVGHKPVLELGDTGTFDEFGTYPISVLKDGNEFRAYYGGWTRCKSVPFDVAIGCATSNNNGVSFEKIGKGPVLSYSPDEPFILSGPKIRKFNNIYYLFYIAGKRWVLSDTKSPEPVYKIRAATSHDGINWTKMNKDLVSDQLGPDEAQASPDVFFHNNLYHMFFCYRQPTDFRLNKKRSYRIGYASSKDLASWVRDDSQAGIDVSDTGWDSEMVAYPHVLELDGNLYMFYLGNQVGRHGFGLAILEH